MSRQEKLRQFLRPWLEFLGMDLWSWPGLNALDRKIAMFLPQRGGWFVEAGANDGYQQSNTYHLARFQKWRGVLVEPVPHLAAACRRNRPESRVYACALGPPELANTQVSLRYAGLMTGVRGALGNDTLEMERAERGLRVQGLATAGPYLFESPVRTLTELLIDSQTPRCFDLLSLDVEGYELRVLEGFDLEQHQARFICLEARQAHLDSVIRWLSPQYDMIRVLHETTEHGDYLFQLRGC